VSSGYRPHMAMKIASLNTKPSFLIMTGFVIQVRHCAAATLECKASA
jgi:hypothetical protein